MKWDDILKVLIELEKDKYTLETRVVSKEGLPIASTLPQGVDETRIAAMTTAMHSLAKESVNEMNQGDFDHLYIKGSDGYLLVMQAGPNTILTVSTTKDVRLGLIFLDCKRTCEKIAKLRDFDYDNDEDEYHR